MAKTKIEYYKKNKIISADEWETQNNIDELKKGLQEAISIKEKEEIKARIAGNRIIIQEARRIQIYNYGKYM